MRILMTSDTLGGVFTYSRDLIGELTRRGHEVCLALQGEPPLCELPCRVHVQPYRLEWMEHPWHDVERAGVWLLELRDSFCPDVVHLNYYAHAALPWRAPTVVVGHSCVLSWHEHVRGCAAGSEWERYAKAVKQGLQAASRVVAVSGDMLAWLEKLYGPLKNSEVIYNGRDRRGLFPAPKLDVVLTAGRLWDEGKNVAALRDLGVDWPVYAAGAGECGSGIEPLGRLSAEELARWFRRAAIFALPARYEPFGLAALEAGLCGCALVLGDLGSLREVWGEAALFVPPGDRQALRAALQWLIRDPELRASMGEAARERAQRYTLSAMADEYLRVYHDLQLLRV